MADTEPNVSFETKTESVTRQYSEFLTKIDDLNKDPTTNTDEYVTKNGKTIKRYHLNGTDFAFLSHTVGIGIPNSNLITSQNIRNEISLWGSTKTGQANNQISCSLITADHISHAVHSREIQVPQVMLGFTTLEDGQLIRAKPGDTCFVVEKDHLAKPNEGNLRSVKDVLNTGNDGKMYNEVVITRYTQNGQTRKPDFIITFDGQMNDRIDQAIDYFNIPIINFNTEAYLNRSDRQTTDKKPSSLRKGDRNAVEGVY